MGGKFPYLPCRKRAYTKGFLFLCCIIQQSQVSACSFTWFSTLLPRRKDQEKYLSCIVFITFWTSLLASSLGLIFDWAKPFEEIGLKTNSYKWKLTPEPRESFKENLDLHIPQNYHLPHPAVPQALFSERMLRQELQEFYIVSHIFSQKEMTWLYCIPLSLCYQLTSFSYKSVNLY